MSVAERLPGLCRAPSPIQSPPTLANTERNKQKRTFPCLAVTEPILKKTAVFKCNKVLKEKSDLLQLENPLPETLGTNSIKNFRLCLKSGTLAST